MPSKKNPKYHHKYKIRDTLDGFIDKVVEKSNKRIDTSTNTKQVLYNKKEIKE